MELEKRNLRRHLLKVQSLCNAYEKESYSLEKEKG